MHRYFSNVLNYNELGFKRFIRYVFMCMTYYGKVRTSLAGITAGLSEVEKAGELAIQGKHQTGWRGWFCVLIVMLT